MQSLTSIVAAIATALVLFLPPLYGLVVYIAALVWYPSYLAISIGTIDFTVRRIVILAVLGKLFIQTDRPNRFKLILLDKLVIIYFLAEILAGATTTQSLEAFMENRGGAIFDMVLPYFAVRLIIRSKQQYLTLLKAVLIIAAPLAIIGFYQCLTGKNPVGFLEEYSAWGGSTYTPIARHGLYRADVTFSMSIMFGLFFAMFGPMCAGLLKEKKGNKILYSLGITLMGIGVFSSMSSGPFLAALLAAIFIAFYHYRRYWRIALTIIILMCSIVEIISNRHFYDILGQFTFDAGTARHRSLLVEVALFKGGMSGHWLTGFGDADPGWGAKMYGEGELTDITNHYLFVLSCFGLIGLIPFLAVVVTACRNLADAFKICTQNSDRWLIWCMSGALFGLLVASFSVALFGQPTSVFFIMLACAGTAPMMIAAENNLSLIKDRRNLLCLEKQTAEIQPYHI